MKANPHGKRRLIATARGSVTITSPGRRGEPRIRSRSSLLSVLEWQKDNEGAGQFQHHVGSRETKCYLQYVYLI